MYTMSAHIMLFCGGHLRIFRCPLAHLRINDFASSLTHEHISGLCCYDAVSLRLSIDNSMHSNSLSTNPNLLLTCLSHFDIRRNAYINHVVLNSLRVASFGGVFVRLANFQVSYDDKIQNLGAL